MELITHGTSDGQGVSELSSDSASWSSFPAAEEPAAEVQGGESIGNGEGGDLMHLELTDFTNATFKAEALQKEKKNKRGAFHPSTQRSLAMQIFFAVDLISNELWTAQARGAIARQQRQSIENLELSKFTLLQIPKWLLVK